MLIRKASNKWKRWKNHPFGTYVNELEWSIE